MTNTPTLEDVAARAGVSTATVSRCLNAPEKVIEPTRARVMAAVEALGYAPNFSARALAAKRTQTIGAVIPTMENAIFAEGLQAFQERLGEAGYMLLVASSSYDPAREAEAIRALVARGAEGLLLIGHDRDPAVIEFLATQSVPALVAWAHDAARPSIGFDNRAAMAALAARALDLGHRRIGVISAPRAGNDRARARVEGVRAAAGAAGLNPDDIPVIEAPYGIEAGGEAFDRLMETAAPSLVICGNDVLAAGALKRARDWRLSVPRDVSITGFDGIELSRLVTPALTTVHVPHRAMGVAAAEALMAACAGEGELASLCLKTEISDGETLAPPR
ncbi:MAG: LacI family DNA-binding transcriptional regulator [Silicimonas sp.]|nr:LacI family DNA-binding transcriptional regulator [Silicimonas sp.]